MNQQGDSSVSGAVNLNLIREGMDVYSVGGDRVGKVREVVFGMGSDEAEGYTNDTGRTLGGADYRDDSVIDNMAEGFVGGDEMPDVLRNRLLTHGYIRIDMSGFFAGDRFATPEQIASIGERGVMLAVDTDRLIEQ